MAFRFYATYEPKPGKTVPLLFDSAARRDAFVSAHPGKAGTVKDAAAPKCAVSNVRMPHQIGAQ